MKSGPTFVTLSLIAFAATTGNAYAYIDPVTGSFIVQGIAAAFAGAMVAFRSLRERVLSLVGIHRKGKPSAGDDGRGS